MNTKSRCLLFQIRSRFQTNVLTLHKFSTRTSVLQLVAAYQYAISSFFLEHTILDNLEDHQTTLQMNMRNTDHLNLFNLNNHAFMRELKKRSQVSLTLVLKLKEPSYKFC